MPVRWDGRAGARYLIASPNFKKCKILDENLTLIELHKSHILMNRPILVGMYVLEISKVLMYEFLYNTLKPKYGDNIMVTYTDTDAYILEVRTKDVYEDIRNDPDEFDTWDYPSDNIFGIKRHNNKIVGKWKDELKGEIAYDSIGIRSKCYILRTVGGIVAKKKAKGVSTNILKTTVDFDDYYKCVSENCIEMRKQYTIRSKDHNVYTISIEPI